MGVKIEWVLVVAIVVTLVSSLILRPDAGIKNQFDNKQLAFTDAKMQEADQSGLVSRLVAKRGEQTSGVLTIYDVHFDKIDKADVSSKSAVYQKSQITLVGNVVIKQPNGYTFYTNKALYMTKTKKIFAPSSYRATFQNNTMNGKNLVYDTVSQSVKSDKVHAVFFAK